MASSHSWSSAPDLKSGDGVTRPWVRILHLPLVFFNRKENNYESKIGIKF